jgi:uncharacterized protein (TIGR02246 family)
MRLVLLTLALCVFVSHGYAAKNTTAKDEAAIRTLADQMTTFWNTHSTKEMAALWTTEGTFIGPTGKTATGRTEIEKFFTDEHTTTFKDSKATFTVGTIQWIKSDVAFVDLDMTVTGAVGTDGKTIPDMKHHVVTVETKKSNKWWIAACRPYTFTTPTARTEASTTTTTTTTAPTTND